MIIPAIISPVINPVAIEIIGFKIHWYAIAYILGIYIGWFYISKLVKNNNINISSDKVEGLILWIVMGIIIGGRFGYVIFYNIDYFSNYPLDIFKIWQGGMSFHGGLLGIILSCIIYAHVKSIPLLSLTDLIASAAPIGLFFGRIANFINGELYGNETTLLWGVIFPHTNMIPRHPTQLYEALLEGLILFLILKISINKYRSLEYPGIISSLFLIYYSIFRIFIEFFRAPDTHIGYLIGPLTTGMLLSIPMFITGLYLYIKIKATQ
ncbi:prolipoprotein diacylglyceryl transferase [Hyphomicrobiales bacterium]|jgi:phosphatidylglycerol:prolipoprotein diacylglycerol transferase|nr:prolipoprotein diacylglyceryl transferase [Rhodobiaceae bacterium]MDC0139249.1 prolipoprotein diacylglyceryl transferase [Hyphomicrobiales bacterium]